jgi:hypothetical protein
MVAKHGVVPAIVSLAMVLSYREVLTANLRVISVTAETGIVSKQIVRAHPVITQ